MTSEIATLTWIGQPVDCRQCDHHALQRDGGCSPGHACMNDRYAPRIDRFFARHPQLAGSHLDHPYFEVRAVAARHVDLFQLRRLVDDPDEIVRWSAVQRLPLR
ncbi:MAG TPA: 4Fe4S-binding leucine-rich repeat protein [Pseudomonadales bacterium]|nr:4Fe4S-binding leucine-rich repeat protein [Pseudomonadales bacterium]